MTTRDYQRAAQELRMLRVEMLVLHALRPRTPMSPLLKILVYTDVAWRLFWHQNNGVPYTTTYEVVRRDCAMILREPRPQ